MHVYLIFKLKLLWIFLGYFGQKFGLLFITTSGHTVQSMVVKNELKQAYSFKLFSFKIDSQTVVSCRIFPIDVEIYGRNLVIFANL